MVESLLPIILPFFCPLEDIIYLIIVTGSEIEIYSE